MLVAVFACAVALRGAAPGAIERQVLDADGRPITTIFNAGDEHSPFPGLGFDPALLIEALSHEKSVASDSSQAPLSYQLTERFDHSDGTYLHFEAREWGLRVLGTEIVVVVTPKGQLEGVSGRLWGYDDVVTDAPVLPLSHVLNGYGLANCNVDECDRILSDEAISPLFGERVWILSFADGRIDIVGQTSGELLGSDPGYVDYAGHTSVNIRRATFSASNPTIPNGNVVSTEFAGYDPDFWIPSNCIWQLGWLPSGVSNRLERTWSECCTDVSEYEPCGSTPTFGGSTGSDVNQQNGYFWVKNTRDWLMAHPWTDHPQTEEANVRVYTDDDAPCYTSDDGCYYTQWHTVYLKDGPLATSFWVPSHEYGHYFVQSYGGLDNLCTFQVNEGRAINEAIADAVSWLSILTSTDVNGTYTSELSNLTRNPVARQHNEQIIAYTNKCASSSYDHGDAFRQAVWEIMNNLDCGATTVCDNSTAYGDDIWIGSTRSVVRDRVGSAIAKALKSTPKNTTFSSIVAWMIADINATSGNTVGTRAYAVFAHHGH